MNLQTILFIVIAFGIGYAFAMLDRRVTTGMRAKRDERKEPKVVEKVVPEKSALSLLLDDPDRPRLRLDGVPLAPGQVTSEQRKRLITLLNLIRPWVEAAPAPPVSQPQAAGMKGEVSAEPAEPTPGLSMTRGLRSVMHNAVITEDPSEGTGLVRQIDSVLQAKLAGSPYTGRHIHLEEGPGGEVLVLVGAQKFSGIEAVPDPGIQNLIREAIGEWERRGGR
jgi:hypothetical protein